MKNIIYIILSLLVLNGCSKEFDLDNSYSDNEKIEFNTYTGNPVKALDKTTFEENDAIKVRAFKHTAGAIADINYLKHYGFEDDKITLNSGIWGYLNTEYWPKDKHLSFFSIYPYDQEFAVISNNGHGSELHTVINVPTDASIQKDIMWAATMDKKKDDGLVNFTFRHAMSRVIFTAALAERNPDAKVTITGVNMSANSNGDFHLPTKENEIKGRWDAFSTEIEYSPFTSTTSSATVTTTATPVGESMLLIPQTVTGKKITITYDVKYTANGQPNVDLTGETFTFTPTADWEQNTQYTYNLKFDLKNISFDVESTISEWDKETGLIEKKTVDFRTYPKGGVSNSYILNPDNKKETDFIIPIATRINTYWGEFYENILANKIVPDNQLTAEILWTDFEEKGLKVSLVQNPMSLNKMGFTANVIPGLEGNAVVAIKKEGVILWSWHLWITDYNPDAIADVIEDANTATTDQYVYTVTGQTGAVHRYADGVGGDNINGVTKPWAGDYAAKFIMDRNLGAVSTATVPDYGKGNLYYQFGRKDPFTKGQCTSATEASMKDAIQHPNVFYASNDVAMDWNTDTKYHGSNIPWNDKDKIDRLTEKSIFDPSPLGWKLPLNGTFSDFADANKAYTSHCVIKTDGLSYRGEIFFPYSGGLFSGGVFNQKTTSFLYNASPLSDTEGYATRFRKTASEVSTNNTRSTALPVRCIRE